MTVPNTCEWCGLAAPKIAVHIEGFDRPVYFCCILHKKNWEDYNAERQIKLKETVLPTMRVLIGRKQEGGTIAVLPWKGLLSGHSVEEESGHKRD
jgi:hypothetical protein